MFYCWTDGTSFFFDPFMWLHEGMQIIITQWIWQTQRELMITHYLDPNRNIIGNKHPCCWILHFFYQVLSFQLSLRLFSCRPFQISSKHLNLSQIIISQLTHTDYHFLVLSPLLVIWSFAVSVESCAQQHIKKRNKS